MTSTPRGLMELDGKLVVRRVYLEPDPSAPILCPHDHEIRAASDLFDGIGAHRCGVIIGSTDTGPQICGAYVGVIEGSVAASVRFDLTAAERDTFKRGQWRASQILEYLGLTL